MIPPSSPSTAVCRICHAANETLISPCKCRGTQAYTHAACLQRWIRHRATSQPSARALVCELCATPYRHVLSAPHPVRFLLGAAAWPRWAHVCYMAFVARRMLYELRLMLRLLRARRRGRLGFSGLLSLHYALFLVLDGRCLWAEWQRWRAETCTIVLLDRDEQVE